MGTDMAIETADVALMGQDLRHLPHALGHARRSRRIMLQNVGMSLALITVLIPLAAFGVLGLAVSVPNWVTAVNAGVGVGPPCQGGHDLQVGERAT